MPSRFGFCGDVASFWSRFRPVIVIGALFLIFVAAAASGAFDNVDPETIRATITEAGAWGVGLFVLLFAVGELVHIPGMVFVAGAVLAYGPLGGFAVGLAGAIFSVTVSFWLVRTFGGQALDKIRWKVVQNILAKLDDRPVTTVVVLRSLLWLAPPLNFALAMSRVKFRDYFVGSALGLLAPVAVMAFFFEHLIGLMA